MDALPATLLYQDDNYVAVDKPTGLAAIPERAGDPECLQARLSSALGARLWVVHRIDKEAGGLIIFAKNPKAHKHLNDLFAARKVEKTYLAVAHGAIAADEGRIDVPLREFGSGRIGADPARGKPSLTTYRVLERRSEATLVEVRLHTGRRHQIRAHFYAIGHPLVGDVRYGDRAAQAKFPRLMLHAWKLAFTDRDGRAIAIEATPPPEFRPAS